MTADREFHPVSALFPMLPEAELDALAGITLAATRAE